MRKRHVAGLAVILILVPCAAAQPAYRNLNFETVVGGRPWGWSYGGIGYDFAPDHTTAFSGDQSIRISYISGPVNSPMVYQYLPIDLVRGKHVRFSGYVKTTGIANGAAYLALQVDTSFPDLAPADGVVGTTGWQAFSIERDIGADASYVTISGVLAGTGTVWFDAFEVSVDGVPLAQGQPPNVGEPTMDQVNWVRQAANPFWTPDPKNGLDDLWPLKNIVGDSRIVGLGEGTHGTSEFFRVKHRILEYLATEMGFTIFAMEANMPEADRLNDYILNGTGDPKKLLQAFQLWPWKTEEVLDLILWMRQFNLSGKGRVQFTGFDMQYGAAAVANVSEFIAQADPSYLSMANSALALARAVQSKYEAGISQPAGDILAATDAVHAVWQWLTDHRADYLSNYAASTVDWAIQMPGSWNRQRT
jgi:erythromycin esterase